MLKCEHETHLLLNDADKEEGFFRFGTTKPEHFTRLIRRIGGKEKLLECRESKEKGTGRTIEWICKVPIEYSNPTNWAVGKRGKRVLSPAAALALREFQFKKKINS